VWSPDGSWVAWFVGITTHELLVGFFVLDRDCRLLRYSAFAKQPGSSADCPPATDWLDPSRAVERARSTADPAETLGPPFMSFDRVLDRLAWAVPATNPEGGERTIFVAGSTVFTAGDEAEPTTGGAPST
jgi:hypothetical protein